MNFLESEHSPSDYTGLCWTGDDLSIWTGLLWHGHLWAIDLSNEIHIQTECSLGRITNDKLSYADIKSHIYTDKVAMIVSVIVTQFYD